MSLEDLQYTEQYLTYIEGLLQQAVDSISAALAYAAQHANESQDSGGVHQALQLLETSMHNLVDLRAEAHGAVQAEIATEHDRQANAPADPDGLENPYE